MDKMDTMPFSWKWPVFLLQYVATLPNPEWEASSDEEAWAMGTDANLRLVGTFTVTISLN